MTQFGNVAKLSIERNEKAESKGVAYAAFPIPRRLVKLDGIWMSR